MSLSGHNQNDQYID